MIQRQLDSRHSGARLLAATLFSTLSLTAGAAMDSETRVDESAQQALAVTIYNDNLALVKDLRGLTLTEGENRLAWRGVSVQVRP